MKTFDVRVQVKALKQIDDITCGHTCLSMVTGISIEKIVERFGVAPIADEIEAIVLTESGILPVPMIQMGGVMHFVEGVYFATVPSLNKIGLGHRIVIRVQDQDFTVYDPQFGREGKYAYPPGAMSGDQPALKHWSELIFLHPMYGHSAMFDRVRRYQERDQ